LRYKSHLSKILAAGLFLSSLTFSAGENNLEALVDSQNQVVPNAYMSEAGGNTIIYQLNGNNEILKGVELSGSFDIPSRKWIERWQAYNGSPKQFDKSESEGLFTTYLLQDFKINRKVCWKEINGENMIWFGDRNNARNSFDAWYVGSYPYESPPARRKSIPVHPTFIPNHKIEHVEKPWLGEPFPGEPLMREVEITTQYQFRTSPNGTFVDWNQDQNITLQRDSYFGMRLVYITSSSVIADDEIVVKEEYVPLRISSICLLNNGVEIKWNSKTDYLYDVLKTEDLLKEFEKISEGLHSTPPENIFIDENVNSKGFYKVKEYKN
jgi:hypothetical protein